MSSGMTAFVNKRAALDITTQLHRTPAQGTIPSAAAMCSDSTSQLPVAALRLSPGCSSSSCSRIISFASCREDSLVPTTWWRLARGVGVRGGGGDGGVSRGSTCALAAAAAAATHPAGAARALCNPLARLRTCTAPPSPVSMLVTPAAAVMPLMILPPCVLAGTEACTRERVCQST
jgi:hypothetical protein